MPITVKKIVVEKIIVMIDISDHPTFLLKVKV